LCGKAYVKEVFMATKPSELEADYIACKEYEKSLRRRRIGNSLLGRRGD
jgi:hypothetical protein